MSTPINRSWQMSGFGLSRLSQVEGKVPEPGPHDLLVRTKAVSLNYKDKMIVDGVLIPDLAFPFVPTSDAVGEVVAVGSAVSRFQVGQRVLGQVIADWPDGDAPPVLHKHTLGSSLSGMLSDHVIFGEDAAVLAPLSLGDIEAATLPIAALTAWFAMAEATKPVPGQTILIQGTGGVSLFALQFATAFGLRAIVTSSSDEKLERARKLGAWQGINYRTQPAWDDAARELTNGLGVNHVLEMVGGDNARRSLNALAADGRLSIIGLLGAMELSFPILPFMRNRITVQGLSIGHRRAFERMNQAIEALAIKPVIDKVFGFDEVPQALQHLEKGPFGKIVITTT
ncbi:MULTISPECIES: NAD(P)-dependent alcohol dehydrogenase [unclassified Mesorhizobium]|uniref:zinc-dependent alcohol dehydrogenase family protein n=1 Tax=unclassified Mesorhizobium TaxID=325217 RepID=UPI000FC99E1A|nr:MULTISPECIES: NAD(P)-dependent alcohol dehydrogenase [unclassified Mesorhizobium]MBZ9721996.1 NAD(P)-dependent alcohol dehydrogenase [Mesorhizobium sp. AD1-1]RUY83974.1 NAD(P)-dependent alcohol dehydrogenase [Mesorhizobium sp. M7A.F.Ca.CA.001.12.2.1]RUZ29173.1 NAD(P)-dependent alcohol dehydrogenase [Mesorhizobium sp. M7A.F.Ca.US.007.01.2.1]RUZ41834.1 NAD(P)-dependent alcohol dehydrogenase [Mesorhizobium sp. M7A.F.Ca.US.003.02.1.1]RUZ48485.1 NAD(P)-dependent alcohol dehydrogenase [Mesorhizob